MKYLVELKEMDGKYTETKYKKTNGGMKKMVDVSGMIESDFLTVEAVREAKEKKLVLLDGGETITTKWNTERLEFKVQIDKKNKTWLPNTETLRNLANSWGNNTDKWIGKVVMLSTAEKNGKKYIVGFPL